MGGPSGLRWIGGVSRSGQATSTTLPNKRLQPTAADATIATAAETRSLGGR